MTQNIAFSVNMNSDHFRVHLELDLYNKIFDIFVRSYIGTINSHGFFGGWFYKFVYDMDEEFTPISPRDEKKFNNNRLVFKKDTYTCISLH